MKKATTKAKKTVKKVSKPYELSQTPHGKVNMIVNGRVENTYYNMEEAEKAAMKKYAI